MNGCSQLVVYVTGNTAKIIDKNNELIAVAYKENRTYKIKSTSKNKESVVNTAECNYKNMSRKEEWDRKLGHVNFGYLSTLCKQELLTAISNEIKAEFMKCKTFLENKMHNLTFSKNNRV